MKKRVRKHEFLYQMFNLSRFINPILKMGQFNKLYIIYILFFIIFKCISINVNVFQWACHVIDAGSMRGVEQDQPPFYYSSELESELFTGDRLQLQLYKASESIGFDTGQ